MSGRKFDADSINRQKSSDRVFMNGSRGSGNKVSLTSMIFDEDEGKKGKETLIAVSERADEEEQIDLNAKNQILLEDNQD